MVKKIISFIQGSKDELKRVTWPDREEVTSFTVIVLFTTVFLSIFLWIVDSGIMVVVRFFMR